jgi:hypothetical protein
MVHLREASGADEDQVYQTALTDQAAIFNNTADARAGLIFATRFSVPATALVVAAAYFAGPVVQTLWEWAAILLRAAASETDSVSNHWRWHEAVVASGLDPVDLATGLAVGGLWILLGIHLLVVSVRRSVSQIRGFHTAMRAEVQDRMLAAYHEIVNRSGEQLLHMRTAPGLSGRSADQALDRSELARVRALIFDLDAGAIAISGGRGVGKTTLLRMLGGDDSSSHGRTPLVIDVAAPVKYETREFVIHLYGELARKALAEVGSSERRARLLRLGGLLRSLAASLLLASGFLVLYIIFAPALADWLSSRKIPVPQNPAAAVLLSVTLWWLSHLLGKARRVPDGRLAVEAQRGIEQTRFLQTLGIERHGALGVGRLQFGRRWSRQLSEQPLALPEVVANYRRFAAMVAQWWRDNRSPGGKLVIAIDEVDRIVDPNFAEGFLNEVKAVFGIEHCVYLVSVSEEALANFERRIARVRTVFDSAFDDIIRLRPFTAAESVELLRRRLAGVPDRFLLLCHCLGGGMPRDVVQTARTMLDVHRARLGASSLTDISRELVMLEVAAVKRGFLSHNHDDSILTSLAATISVDERRPGETSRDLGDTVSQVLAYCHENHDHNSPVATLGAALYFYCTVLDIYTSRVPLVSVWAAAVRRPSMRTNALEQVFAFDGRSVRRWPYEEETPAPERDQVTGGLTIVRWLDNAHRMLPTNPFAAITELTTIRGRLGLQIPTVLQSGFRDRPL